VAFDGGKYALNRFPTNDSAPVFHQSAPLLSESTKYRYVDTGKFLHG